MKHDLKNILLDLDFTPTEAEVYLFLLKHSSATVNEIVKETETPLRTVYESLENFKRNGLVSILDIKPRKYIMESPRQLVNFVENKIKAQREIFEKKQMEKKEKANMVWNKFSGMQSHEKPQVRFFEGVNGVKSINEDIKNSQPDIVYNLHNWDIAEESLKNNSKLRDSKSETLLSVPKVESIYYSNRGAVRESSKNFECYHTDEKINAEISIYKEKVAMVDYKTKENRMGVIVENKNISDALKALFKLAKKHLEKK